MHYVTGSHAFKLGYQLSTGGATEVRYSLIHCFIGFQWVNEALDFSVNQ